MRTKTLIIDGEAGSRGPVVNLESGVWEIDAHTHVDLEIDAMSTASDEVKTRIVGPGKVIVVISDEYEGPPIHVQVRGVA